MSDTPRIHTVLSSSGLYTAYFDISSDIEAPYIVWRGSGQNNFIADDTFYFRMGNTYEATFYYLDKDESTETAIEDALIEGGYIYDKSGDMRDSDTGEFFIVYNIRPDADHYDEEDEP